ncbi:hypothetical protein QE152_g29399 [Popillia japonica]|uniref:Uncharacterized protein n=1 Tax=Popillia japonica TaxID=7064 RepID=A0AAW1JHE5_POPJA
MLIDWKPGRKTKMKRFRIQSGQTEDVERRRRKKNNRKSLRNPHNYTVLFRKMAVMATENRLTAETRGIRSIKMIGRIRYGNSGVHIVEVLLFLSARCKEQIRK